MKNTSKHVARQNRHQKIKERQMNIRPVAQMRGGRGTIIIDHKLVLVNSYSNCDQRNQSIPQLKETNIQLNVSLYLICTAALVCCCVCATPLRSLSFSCMLIFAECAATQSKEGRRIQSLFRQCVVYSLVIFAIQFLA